MPTNHEVTISDLYSLMMVVRDDVTKINASTESVRKDIDDHESRIRDLDRQVKDSVARHQLNRADIERANTTISEQATSIDDLKKRIYQYAGAAAVIGVVATPVVNSFLGK